MIPIPAEVISKSVYRPLLDLLDGVYLKASEVGARLRFDDGYLANLRRAGNGPPWSKFASGAVRYQLSELLEWELSGKSPHITMDRVALAVLAFPGIDDKQKLELTEHLRAALVKRAGA